MAVFFQLYRLGSHEPSRFAEIDNAICHNLDLPWDDDKYACGWYDSIGLRLALGKSFAEIGEEFQKYLTDISVTNREHDWFRNILRINHFLAEHYTSDAWFGR